MSDSWSPISTAGAPEARYGHTSIWTGDRMLVWGGQTSVLTNTGASYDPRQDTWTDLSMAGAVPAPRSNQVAVSAGGEARVTPASRLAISRSSMEESA